MNTVNSQACGRKATAEPQITFRRNLTCDVIENKIEIICQPKGSPSKTRSMRKPIVHDLKNHPIYTGRWDPVKGNSKSSTDYMHLKSTICKNRTTRIYCS